MNNWNEWKKEMLYAWESKRIVIDLNEDSWKLSNAVDEYMHEREGVSSIRNQRAKLNAQN